MSDRKLVVIEDDTGDPDYGRLFALPPSRATGVPIPAFRTGPNRPTVGAIQGEAFLETTSNSGFVWDGRAWQPIVPSVIVKYGDDTTLLADTRQPAGSYGAASDTGNLYVMGASGWRFVGIKTFPTEAGLLATTQPDGSMAFAIDNHSLWGRAGGNWECLTTRVMPDFATLSAWTPADGTEAIASDTGLYFTRVNGAWEPKSVLIDTEANIKIFTGALKGQMAVATDTARFFVNDGTHWIGEPFMDYATEAALLAASPGSNTIAVALDTGRTFFYDFTNTTWKGLNGYQMPTGAADPATAADGDLFYNTTDQDSKIYVSGAWKSMSVNSLNDLSDVDTATTPPTKNQTLVFDDTDNKFKPGLGGGVIVGAEPAVADRYAGMLWWDSGSLWVWDTVGVWVEV